LLFLLNSFGFISTGLIGSTFSDDCGEVLYPGNFCAPLVSVVKLPSAFVGAALGRPVNKVVGGFFFF
jgi:hypothetical protein